MFTYDGIGVVGETENQIVLTEAGRMPWAGARHLTSNPSSHAFFVQAVEEFERRVREKDYGEVPLTRLPGKDYAQVQIRGPQGGGLNLKEINGELYATLPMRGLDIIDGGLLDVSAGRMEDHEQFVPRYRGWEDFFKEELTEEVAVVIKGRAGKRYLCVPRVENDDEISALLQGKVKREADKPAFRGITSGSGLAGTEFVDTEFFYPDNAAEFVVRYADGGVAMESRFKAGHSWDVYSGSVEAIMIARMNIEGDGVQIYDTETKTPEGESWHRRTCMINVKKSGETSILRDGVVVNKEYGLSEPAPIGDVLDLIERERAAEAEKRGRPLDPATGIVSTGKVQEIIKYWPEDKLGAAPALREILKRERVFEVKPVGSVERPAELVR